MTMCLTSPSLQRMRCHCHQPHRRPRHLRRPRHRFLARCSQVLPPVRAGGLRRRAAADRAGARGDRSTERSPSDGGSAIGFMKRVAGITSGGPALMTSARSSRAANTTTSAMARACAAIEAKKPARSRSCCTSTKRRSLNQSRPPALSVASPSGRGRHGVLFLIRAGERC